MLMSRVYLMLIALKRVMIVLFSGVVLLAAIHFPYDVDAPLTQQQVDAARKYYTEAYQKPETENQTVTEYQTEYLRVAEAAAKEFRIEELVQEFARQYKLADRAVLEIGSGRGYLQDIVENYTGLDISPSVARFYHKKFILGSATALPFADNSFDGIWSIWVFEHVPNPEQAFLEARRVTRDKGVILLMPAWNCTPWAAEGYEVRPYSDFGPFGKIVKSSILLRSAPPFVLTTLIPNRMVRDLVARFGPTGLRYRRLKPNYDKYWVADSDAVNSIDVHEAWMWFRSRGDECLNCEGSAVFMTSMPLVIRVHKTTQ